jgi:hypothetical protein
MQKRQRRIIMLQVFGRPFTMPPEEPKDSQHRYSSEDSFALIGICVFKQVLCADTPQKEEIT